MHDLAVTSHGAFAMHRQNVYRGLAIIFVMISLMLPPSNRAQASEVPGLHDMHQLDPARLRIERGTKTMVFLRDPNAREFWVMEPERRRARRLDRQGPAALVLDHDQRQTARTLMLQRLEDRGLGQRSDLGQRAYEGIQVQGELTTWTIEAGRVGNDKAIVITREVWQSPELMIPVSIQDRDPRFGERFLRVFNIKREEPEPELMRVPGDFLKLEMEQRRPRLLGP